MFQFVKKHISKKWYDIGYLMSLNCDINIVISERSDGKTFSALKYCLNHYLETGNRFVYLRQMREDFQKGRGQQVFNGLAKSNEISKMTNGEFDFVKYKNSNFYLQKSGEDEHEVFEDFNRVCYAMTLSETYHNKSTNYDDVDLILFDEFLSMSYLLDEFTLFQDTVSTIVRKRGNVRLIMLGNKLNYLDNPYLENFGLTNDVKYMEPGHVYVYSLPNGLKIAIEFPSLEEKSTESDKYFNFINNAHSQMITDGKWDFGFYPRLDKSFEYDKKKIKFIFFIEYKNNLLQCELIKENDDVFIYVHRKTTEIKKREKEIIFTDKETIKRNEISNIYDVRFKFQKSILDMIRRGQIRYQDNWTGNIFDNYLKTCKN